MPAHLNPILPTPVPAEYFDYTAAAHDAGLTPEQLRSLTVLFEQDYPNDIMLRELHILRACNAVARGAVTIQEVLSMHGQRAA